MIHLQLHHATERALAFVKWMISPASHDDDTRRKERILNTLLLCAIGLSFCCLLITIRDTVAYDDDYVGMPLWILAAITLLFVGTYALSRRGHQRLASYLLLAFFAIPTIYASARWGIDLPQVILIDALIITMASVLISTRFSLIAVALLSIALITLATAHEQGIIVPQSYWRAQPAFTKDAIALSLTFVGITVVSWLSNRAIESSLARALSSESALTEERNLLEEKVLARTKELQETQREKLTQMTKFAEFGRIAAGLTHDLASPLTALSINLEHLAKEDQSINLYASHALRASKQLEDFLGAARKQLQGHDINEPFIPAKETAQVLEILGYKSKISGVPITVDISPLHTILGNPLKFQKLIMNLAVNAIESYESMPPARTKRGVAISLTPEHDHFRLTVQDWGSGIPEDAAPLLFQPFFTTKSLERGVGIGLSICKDIVENNFHGTIEFESKLGKGTRFTATLFSS